MAKNSYTLVIYIYIVNHYLNKKIMFSNYTFSNSNFLIFFSKFLFENQKLFLKLFLKIFIYFSSIYLYIYWNPKFHIPKTLPHPLTLNPNYRLVNPRGIIVKVKVKVVSVNMKSDTINVVFVAISFIYNKYNKLLFK